MNSPYLTEARDLSAPPAASAPSAGSRPGAGGIELPLDPRIGVLVGKGGARYYVWLGGYEPECYFEGTLAEVEAVLARPLRRQ